MPQLTDLNISPYYDDYDTSKNFHRILFRPSVPVQARELTQTQDILQNQIEKYGQYQFKEGSIVSGCTITYDRDVKFIKLENADVISRVPLNVLDYNEGDLVHEPATGMIARIEASQNGSEAQNPYLNTLFLKYIFLGTEDSREIIRIKGGTGTDTSIKITKNSFGPGDILDIYRKNAKIDTVTVESAGSGYDPNVNYQIWLDIDNDSLEAKQIGIIPGNELNSQGSVTLNAAAKLIELSITDVENYSRVIIRKGDGSDFAENDEEAPDQDAELKISLKKINQAKVASDSSLTEPGVGRQNEAEYNLVGNSYMARANEGIIFHRGTFLKFPAQSIIIAPYTNEPSGVRLGVEVREEIITEDIDASLYDPSLGSPNYSGPGAHRLKMTPYLVVHAIDTPLNPQRTFYVREWKDGFPINLQNIKDSSAFEEGLSEKLADITGDYVLDTFPVVTEKIGGNTEYFSLMVGEGTAFIGGRRFRYDNPTRRGVRTASDTMETPESTIVSRKGGYIEIDSVVGKFNPEHEVIVSSRAFNVSSADSLDLTGTQFGNSNKIGIAYINKEVIDVDDFRNEEANPTHRLYIDNIFMEPGQKFNEAVSVFQPNANSLSNSAAFASISDHSFKDSITKPLIFKTGNKGTDSVTCSNLSFDSIRTVSGTGNNIVKVNNLDIQYEDDDRRDIGEIIVYPRSEIDRYMSNSTVSASINTYNEVSLTGTTGWPIKSKGDIVKITKSGTDYFRKINNITSSNTFSIENTSVVGTYTLVAADIDTANSNRLNNFSDKNITPAGGPFSTTIADDIPTVSGGTGAGATITSITVNSSGTITGVIWNARGTNYAVGDVLTFTQTSNLILNDDSAGNVKLLYSEKFPITLHSDSDHGARLEYGTSGTLTLTLPTNTNATFDFHIKQYADSTTKTSARKTKSLVTSMLKFKWPDAKNKSICLGTPDVFDIISVLEYSNTGIDGTYNGASLDLNNIANGDIMIASNNSVLYIANNNNEDADQSANVSVGETGDLIRIGNANFQVTNSANTTSTGYISYEGSLVPESTSAELTGTTDSTLFISKPSTDIKDKFEILNNSYDTYYGLSDLKLKEIEEDFSSNSIFVATFRHFVPSDYNTLGYFEGGSLDNNGCFPINDLNPSNTEIRTQQIPVHISPDTGQEYDLRDCIDFRRYVSNTITTNTDIVNSNWLTSNTWNHKFTASSNNYSIVDFDYTVKHYLPRKDLLIISKDGIIKTQTGIPRLNPVYPALETGALQLATIDIPVYPSLDERSAAFYKRPDLGSRVENTQRRGYKMEDIKSLDDRITRLEETASYNLLESLAMSEKIPGIGPLEKFKSGIIVDGFGDQIPADTESVEFNISYDYARKAITMPKKERTIEFEVDLTQSNNIQQTGELISLPYSTENGTLLTSVLSNKKMTRSRICASNYHQFRGILDATPDYISDATDMNLITLQETIKNSQPVSNTIISNDNPPPFLTSKVSGGDHSTQTGYISYYPPAEIKIKAYGLAPKIPHYLYFDGINIAPEQITPNHLATNDKGSISFTFRVPPKTFISGERTLVVSDAPFYDEIINSESLASCKINCFNYPFPKIRPDQLTSLDSLIEVYDDILSLVYAPEPSYVQEFDDRIRSNEERLARLESVINAKIRELQKNIRDLKASAGDNTDRINALNNEIKGLRKSLVTVRANVEAETDIPNIDKIGDQEKQVTDIRDNPPKPKPEVTVEEPITTFITRVEYVPEQSKFVEKTEDPVSNTVSTETNIKKYIPPEKSGTDYKKTTSLTKKNGDIVISTVYKNELKQLPPSKTSDRKIYQPPHSPKPPTSPRIRGTSLAPKKNEVTIVSRGGYTWVYWPVGRGLRSKVVNIEDVKEYIGEVALNPRIWDSAVKVPKSRFNAFLKESPNW